MSKISEIWVFFKWMNQPEAGIALYGLKFFYRTSHRSEKVLSEILERSDNWKHAPKKKLSPPPDFSQNRGGAQNLKCELSMERFNVIWNNFFEKNSNIFDCAC